MQKSDTIAKLADALAKAQSEIKSVSKDRTNPHFKNRYATLDAILDAVRPTLAKHGLSVVQGASDTTQGFNVETFLVHASGEYIANVVAVPVSKQDAQGVGSALTYGRRYGVSALLALSTDEDDDGEAAVKPPKKADPKPEPKPEPKKEPEVQADDPRREWDGTDADALHYRFPVKGSPNYGKRMEEISDADLQKFVSWAGVKPDWLNVRIRAEAILTHRSAK
jgi:ERF superfamily